MITARAHGTSEEVAKYRAEVARTIYAQAIEATKGRHGPILVALGEWNRLMPEGYRLERTGDERVVCMTGPAV